MNLRTKTNVIVKSVLCALLIAQITTPFAYAGFEKNQKTSKLVIVLIDETDSFGKDTKHGVAKSLYWDDALKMTKTIVHSLGSGDEFLLLAIDEKGFQEEDIRIPFHQFDRAFLRAKLEKNKITRKILSLARRKEKYSRTDILGALYQAAHFAQKEQGREIVLFCFSDMKQEPKEPSLADAKSLRFPPNSTGYFFFVDASGRDEWQRLVEVWHPIFQSAGLNANHGNSIAFFQHGESNLRINRIIAQWSN